MQIKFERYESKRENLFKKNIQEKKQQRKRRAQSERVQIGAHWTSYVNFRILRVEFYVVGAD